MSQLNDVVMNMIRETETILNRGLDNVYINTSIKVLIGLYAGFAAPKLPPTLVNLMDNIFVRIGFAFTIVLLATRDPSIALMVAVAFIITLQTANKYRLINTDLSVSDQGQSSWLPSAKAPNLLNQENFSLMDQLRDDVASAISSTPAEEEPFQNSTGMAHPALQEPVSEDVNAMAGSNPSNNLGDVQSNSVPDATEASCLFTTPAQFQNAQDNTVPNANQQSCQSTFANQHCTQGLNTNIPTGSSL
jgi:hypothetical protein